MGVVGSPSTYPPHTSQTALVVCLEHQRSESEWLEQRGLLDQAVHFSWVFSDFHTPASASFSRKEEYQTQKRKWALSLAAYCWEGSQMMLLIKGSVKLGSHMFSGLILKGNKWKWNNFHYLSCLLLRVRKHWIWVVFLFRGWGWRQHALLWCHSSGPVSQISLHSPI